MTIYLSSVDACAFAINLSPCIDVLFANSVDTVLTNDAGLCLSRFLLFRPGAIFLLYDFPVLLQYENDKHVYMNGTLFILL